MKQKKKNKGLVLLIVNLIILVLIGYIVYDKVLSKLNNLKNENTTSTTTTTSSITQDSSFDDSISKIIMKNRIKNYELIEEENKTFDYKFKCTEEDTECMIPNFIINNKKYELGPDGNVYLFDRYVVIKTEGGDGFGGEITIVNHEGEKLYSERYVGTYCDNLCEYFGIQGDEEKLYFIVNEDSKLILKSIDLKNNLKIENIAISTSYTQAG